MRMLILGIAIGGAASLLIVGGLAAVWGWRAGATAAGREVIAIPTGVQIQVPGSTPNEAPNPREFAPVPNMPGNLPGQGPDQSPGAGGQNCDKILFFYNGKLYQLRPGEMPKNGNNPEFFFMQPYQGPSIPGFPEQTEPGAPAPGVPTPQQLPPTFKF